MGLGVDVGQTEKIKTTYPLSFRAVRGPLTRAALLDAGYICPAVYGAPALLLPKFYKVPAAKKFKLGDIPHFYHHGLMRLGDGVKFISVFRSVQAELEKCIDEINECEMVLSSSLHGIIIAQAYGIPARYFRVPGRPLAEFEELRFAGYFQSVKMPNQEPLVLEAGSTIVENCLDSFDKTVDLKIDLERLLEVFPRELRLA